MVERTIVVVVTTYRRAGALVALLPAVAAQAAALTDHTVRTVVVDNDPDESARSVTADAGWEYVAEPHAGIGAARHRALAAGEGRDLVVMLDDDLTPEPGWLDALVAAWMEYRPSVVMGYVRYVWPEGTDPWIAAGGFLRRTRYPTGTTLDSLATGSVLIDSADAARRGVQFDPALDLAGGEDTKFGAQLLAAGGTIIASGDAVAREEIPRERATVAFVKRRAISHGESRSRVSLEPVHGARLVVKRGVLLAGGAARWAVFFAAHVITRARGDVARDAQFRRRAWFAIGRMRGAVGRFGSEYARHS